MNSKQIIILAAILTVFVAMVKTQTEDDVIYDTTTELPYSTEAATEKSWSDYTEVNGVYSNSEDEYEEEKSYSEDKYEEKSYSEEEDEEEKSSQHNHGQNNLVYNFVLSFHNMHE
ncbi:hypothetical protein L9F63_020932 [Diploptera punctata]|uniref:Uncharacterized protein n=1 Tax=Diploptera punctata TaxID=6984 RepID=A0AAD8ECH5_DIPPU|nr:hypothetical protein L9F63_020932 [Diploptera punctata]